MLDNQNPTTDCFHFRRDMLDGSFQIESYVQNMQYQFMKNSKTFVLPDAETNSMKDANFLSHPNKPCTHIKLGRESWLAMYHAQPL
jgi:hypothetical protein